MTVFSGVAMVSAYEAHTVNVTVKVEDAITCNAPVLGLQFGTVFPEEWLIEDRAIALSSSANATLGEAEGDLDYVDYTVWAEYKIQSAGATPTYYIWLGDWLWVGIDATTPSGSSKAGWNQVGSQPDAGFDNDGTPGVPTGDMAKATACTGTLDSDTPQILRVMLLAPCFHTYYNADTDTKPLWWPTPDTAEWPLLDQALHDGVDLGLDLKIQVDGIGRVGPPQ